MFFKCNISFKKRVALALFAPRGLVVVFSMIKVQPEVRPGARLSQISIIVEVEACFVYALSTVQHKLFVFNYLHFSPILYVDSNVYRIANRKLLHTS